MQQVFSAAATKAWAWWKHNSECTCPSGQFLIASWLLLHGNRPLQDATTNGLGDRKPNDRIKTSLWQAWVWVAWIERGHQIWVQKIYGEKSFESITDSQLKHRPWRSSWIVTPNSIIHPYRLSDLFMNWMSLLDRIAEINSWNQLTCHINLLSAVCVHLQLKGWHVQPDVAKSSISTILRRFEAVAA